MRRLIFKVFIALLTFATGVTLAGLLALPLTSLISRGIPNLPDERLVQILSVSEMAAPTAPAPQPKRIEGLRVRAGSVFVSVGNFFSIEAEYPQIIDNRTSGARRFNRWVEDLILRQIAEFKRSATADMREYLRLKQEPLVEESLVISYEVLFSGPKLMSVRVTYTVMAPGQMHPIDYYETINYDLIRSRPLSLRELFKPGAKYLEAISLYCLDELRKKYDQQSLFEEGAEPKADNFKNWNITPEGIFISFEDYQVGPHAMGQPELLVPYHVLKDLLAKESLSALSIALTD